MWNYTDYLFERSTQRTLEDVKELYGLLGNPEQSMLCIQIAGTNGKGSTSAMLASILQSAGYKTGLNTSPALVNVTERIRIDNKDISDELFAKYASKVKQAEELSGKRFGGFDRMTACALLAFSEAGVETAVLETGLGGRKDAVTAVDTHLTAITSIGFDHMQYLGNTIESIASEKCGILKPGVPVICHPQLKEAEDVIRKFAARLDCEIKFVDPSQIECKGFRNGITYMRYSGIDAELPLMGSHQCVNAACAIEMAKKLRESGLIITDESIVSGLKSVRWYCRLEFFKGAEGNADILIDGAHNADGMRTLARAVNKYYPEREIVALMCIMKDKDAAGISKEAAGFARTAVLTTVNERSMDTGLLKSYFESAGIKAHPEPDVSEAFDEARRRCPDNGLIVVAGSLFLAGAVRDMIMRERA